MLEETGFIQENSPEVTGKRVLFPIQKPCQYWAVVVTSDPIGSFGQELYIAVDMLIMYLHILNLSNSFPMETANKAYPVRDG